MKPNNNIIGAHIFARCLIVLSLLIPFRQCGMSDCNCQKMRNMLSDSIKVQEYGRDYRAASKDSQATKSISARS
jgi:hypothetical protein